MCTTYLPTIFSLLPAVVQNGIKEITKKTSKGSTGSTLVNSYDKLFFLSEKEITGKNTLSFAGEGTQYQYYINGGSKIKNRNSSPISWWTRSPTDGSGSFVAISTSGGVLSSGASATNAVSFAFCF